MKLSDYIVNFIADRGVVIVFGYIGGAITHLVDSLDRSDRVVERVDDPAVFLGCDGNGVVHAHTHRIFHRSNQYDASRGHHYRNR